MIKNVLLICFFSFCAFAAQGQTYPAPDLGCATTLTGGDVELQWVEPGVLCGPFNNYHIYASNTGIGGPYSLLTSISATGTTNYTHMGAGGTMTVWYYYMVSDFSCAGFTSLHSDTICNRDPIDPSLVRVNVNPAGVDVEWMVSPSPQTAGYIVYRDNAGFNAIDTVWGKNMTSYLDVTSLANSQSERYAMAAVDTCRNVGPLSINPHETIYLSGVTDRCTGEVELSWNGYINWTAGIDRYEVEYSLNAGAPITAASLPSGTSTYTFSEPVNDGDVLCIRVRAVNNDGVTVSHSNLFCENLNIIQASQYQYMSGASANPDNDQTISFYIDNSSDFERIEVLRDGLMITSIPRAGAPAPYTFFDGGGSGLQKSLRYEVDLIDSCGAAVRGTSVESSFLSVVHLNETQNNVVWTPYVLDFGTVTNYELFRIIGGTSTSLGLFAPGTLSYFDDHGAVSSSDELVCYRIEVQYDFNPPLLPLESLTAYSNQACNNPPINILVPNAFSPEGNNNIFRPVFTSTAQLTGYQFSVFSRWGEMIFQSSTPGKGWDGSHQGARCDVGNYVYHVSYNDQDGKAQMLQGTVLLIR